MHLDPVMPYLAIRRMLGDNWRDSLYAAAFLSQIDEFSFVRATRSVSSQLLLPTMDSKRKDWF